MPLHIQPDLDPRIATVPTTDGTEITMQELVDQARAWEQEPAYNSYPLLVKASGKEDLGGGVSVGITVEQQNIKLAFEPRTTSVSSGTCTTANAAGNTLIDSAATFISDGVLPGATLINFTDLSVATVLKVDSEIQLTTYILDDGTADDWTFGDVYKIWNTIQCEASGGNLVAVDDVGAPLPSIFPTAFTQVIRTSSSSATLQELSSIQFSSFEGGVSIDVTSTNTGTDFPVGTGQAPVNNITDALIIAGVRGLTRLNIIGDITIPTGVDVTNFEIAGESSSKSTITVDLNSTTTNAEFFTAMLTGFLDTDVTVTDCHVGNLTVDSVHFHHSVFEGVLTLTGMSPCELFDCKSGLISTIPEIDLGGTGNSLSMTNYNGGMRISNKSGSDAVVIDLNSGEITLDADVTAGSILVRGIGSLIDNSVGATVTNELIEPAKLNLINQILRNRTETNPSTGIMTVYDDDDNVLLTAPVFEDVAGATPFDATSEKILRRNRLT